MGSNGIFMVISVKALAERYESMGMLNTGAAYWAMGITEGDAAAKIAGAKEQDQLAAMAYAHTERRADRKEIITGLMAELMGIRFSGTDIDSYNQDPDGNKYIDKWMDATLRLIGNYRSALAWHAQDKKQGEP